MIWVVKTGVLLPSMKPKTIIDEVRISSKFSAAGAWTIMIKYIAPVLVIIILVAYVAAQFGFFSM